MKRKNRKGFTLIEILAVIAILAVLSAIIYPSVVGVLNKSKEDTYQIQIKEIEDAASKWLYKNASLIPTKDGDTLTIYLGDLKRAGLLDKDLTNPKTSTKFPNDMEILVTRKGKKYTYVVNEKSGTDTGEVVTGIGSIVLKGFPYEYAEVGTSYTDPGVIAISKTGTPVPTSSIVKTIRQNGVTVSSIDMKTLKKYEITYSFTEEGKTVHVQRIVEVRDTTPPVLTIPINTNISVSQASLGLREGVKAVDNYDGDITAKVNIRGNVSLGIPGVYVVTYEVSDSSGNTTKKKRTITVAGDICTAVKITGSTKEGTYTNKDVTLTASTLNGGVPEVTTYQWQKVVNGVWVDIAGATGRTYTEKAETSTKYRVKYKQFQCDSASNEYAVAIDKTPPTCTLSSTGTEGDNGWYKSNATIKIASKTDKGGSTLASYGLSSSTTASYNGKDSDTQKDTKGQTWYGYVKDKAGNVGSCNTTVKVDTVKPTCVSTGGSTDWTNGSRTLTGTCTDSTSGCATPTITKDYSAKTYDTFNSTTETPGTVKDKAGNTAPCPGDRTVRIDRVPPTCESSGGNNAWTSGDRTLLGKCTDPVSGCKGNVTKLYNYDYNKTGLSPGTVYDKAGNPKDCPADQTVRVDKTPPKDLKVEGNPGCVYEPTSIILTLSATETGSGIKEWAYSYDNVNFTSYSNSGISPYTIASAFSKVRDQDAYLRVTDNVGHTAVTTTRICIKKKPVTVGGYAGKWRVIYKQRDGCDYWAAKPDGNCPSGIYGNVVGKVDISYVNNDFTFNWRIVNGAETWIATSYYVDFVIYKNGSQVHKTILKDAYGADWGMGSSNTGQVKVSLGSGTYQVRLEGNSSDPSYSVDVGTITVG